jgi:peptidoglycan/xylan/chitin deacetylase (PgdA/CDA1 family)
MFGMKDIKVRVRSRLKGLPRDAGWQLGMNQQFFRNARGARILVYHGICLSDHLRFSTTFITARTFESQLKLYKKYFNVISLDDFYQQRFSDERFNLCLTFDDGFANNYKYVLPLLDKYGIPATFFITAIRDAGYDTLWNDILNIAHKYGPANFVYRHEDFTKQKDGRYISITTGKQFADTLRSEGFEGKAEMFKLLDSLKHKVDSDYWLQMTQDEIKNLSASKWVTIGSHGFYHNDLAKIPIASAREEMLKSKQWLENITGKEIKALAFPYGSYSEELVDEAKKIGYSQLLATDRFFPGDRNIELLRQRLTINPFISNINQLHANITGNY